MAIESSIRRYTPLSGEIEAIRKNATETSRDPDLAESDFRERFRQANAQTLDAERVRMIRQLKDEVKKMVSNK